MQNGHTSTKKCNSQKNIVDRKLSKPMEKVYSETEASSSKNRFQLLPTLENTEEPMDLGEKIIAESRTEEPKNSKEDWPTQPGKKRKNVIRNTITLIGIQKTNNPQLEKPLKGKPIIVHNYTTRKLVEVAKCYVLAQNFFFLFLAQNFQIKRISTIFSNKGINTKFSNKKNQH